LQQARREPGSDLRPYLEEEVWPQAPPCQLGRRLSREEEDEILGYGPGGVVILNTSAIVAIALERARPYQRGSIQVHEGSQECLL
jgi:hypothetical protein